MEINSQQHDKIVELCEHGDSFFENSDYKSAFDCYKEALDLVPEPKYIWEASTWIYTAIGDLYYAVGQWNDALNSFMQALKCPDGLINAFVLLRIGESFFECGDFEKAQEFLLKAYMCDGTEVFEDEDEKYFALIENMI